MLSPACMWPLVAVRGPAADRLLDYYNNGRVSWIQLSSLGRRHERSARRASQQHAMADVPSRAIICMLHNVRFDRHCSCVAAIGAASFRDASSSAGCCAAGRYIWTRQQARASHPLQCLSGHAACCTNRSVSCFTCRQRSTVDHSGMLHNHNLEVPVLPSCATNSCTS